jgi:ATP-dependent Clp protease, protease subunit
MPRKSKKKEEVEEVVEEVVEEQVEEEVSQEELDDLSNQIEALFMAAPAEEKKEDLRIIGLIGEVSEERTTEVLYSMLQLKQSGSKKELEDPEKEDSPLITVYDPFELWISTYGGSAMDMFAIYDVMRMMREECDISTFGLGKVMSAGVLLLAAGTKGKRKIGANCRVMLHSVIGGSQGPIHSLENEMDEIRWIQDQHVKCLVEETNMSSKHLKKLLARKVNVYLTAEEAVELGIADEVV